MTVLDRFLAKSRAPFTKADIEEALRLYGPMVEVMTHRVEGRIAAFAVLTWPARLLGKTVSTVLMAGTDGTVDARALFERVKSRASELGADTLMASTWRRGEAITRLFGGTVDSVNIKWDLEEAGIGGSPSTAGERDEGLQQVRDGSPPDGGVLLQESGESRRRAFNLQAVRQGPRLGSAKRRRRHRRAKVSQPQ